MLASAANVAVHHVEDGVKQNHRFIVVRAVRAAEPLAATFAMLSAYSPLPIRSDHSAANPVIPEVPHPAWNLPPVETGALRQSSLSSTG